MAQRLYLPIEQVFSDLGAIGAGYKLNTYETGTTTPKATYSNVALSSANTNPIVADSSGRLGNIFVDDLSTYKLVLTDVDDVEVWSADPVDPKTFSLADFDPRPTSFWGTTAGTSTAYTLGADPDVSAYSSTQTFYFACHTDCGDNPTMAVDGLTALNLKKYDNDGSKVSLVTGDMNSGQTYHARNDGTDIVIFNPEIPANISSTTTKKGYSYLPNQITISNGTDTDHDIDFTAGNFQFNDGSGQGVMTAKTGELDAAFGTGNGMLDTGTIAADSTYYLFTVYNPTTGDAKPLASLSSTSPTMTLPDADGYSILGERLGSIITDGSANILVSYLSTRTSFGQVSRFQTGAVATGTTTIPWDNTIPQITEGDEYMTIKHAPLSETSKLIIDVVVNVATNINTNGEMTTALFQDSTANALASVNHYSGVTNTPQNAKLTHHMTSGTISPTTFRVRIGASGANTTTFNGASGGRKGGGVLASSITITEIEA